MNSRFLIVEWIQFEKYQCWIIQVSERANAKINTHHTRIVQMRAWWRQSYTIVYRLLYDAYAYTSTKLILIVYNEKVNVCDLYFCFQHNHFNISPFEIYELHRSFELQQ